MTKTKILLVLPSDVVDRARVLAGRATTRLRLSVSLQIVLRALIEEGLKQADSAALLANVERQALAVRDARRAAREAGQVRASRGGDRRPEQPELTRRRS